MKNKNTEVLNIARVSDSEVVFLSAANKSASRMTDSVFFTPSFTF